MLYSVQLLRALAAILVVVCHAVHKQGQLSGTNDTWEFGGSGVDLFFIISGFIMCYVTVNKKVTTSEFIKARVVRIIPLYWALSLVALAIYIVNPSLVNSSGGVTTVFNSFTLIPTGEKFLIQTGWTLSYELLFYLIYAAFLPFEWRRRLFLVCLAIASLVALGLLLAPSNPTIQFLTGPLLLEFTMGVGAYIYVRNFQSTWWVNIAVLVSGIGLLIAGATVYPALHRVVLYGVPFSFIFASLVHLENVFKSTSSNMLMRIGREIGDASYSLYLSHPFALAAVGFIIRRFDLQHDPILSISLLVVAALSTGYLCYTFVEKNLTKLSKMLMEKIRRRAELDEERSIQKQKDSEIIELEK